jgi:amino acid transporter
MTHQSSGPAAGFKRLTTLDAVGVSVAGMGPTLAMNLNPQQLATHVGSAVPLAFSLCVLLVLMVAWCFARLSSRHPNAGSAYGFVSSVLGPRAGLFAGWALFGTYLAFGMVGISGFGLFRFDIAERFHPLHHPSVFFFTLSGATLITILSVTAARRAAVALILLEGVAVVAMVALSLAVLWLIAQGHGPQGNIPVKDLFIPGPKVTLSDFALALSFGFLSFAGFETVATLGEEVDKPKSTIPRVLFFTVAGGGFVYVLVTTAQILGFGTDAAGVSKFAASSSLLGDLAARYFGSWCGDVVDLLAMCSALGCGLAAIVAASRILFAIFRDLWPSSFLGKLSSKGGTPLNASVVVIATGFLGYAVMRQVFHASGSDAFFWASTMGALGLLIAYLLVVISAGVSILRSTEGESWWKLFIPALAASSIIYVIIVNVYPVQPGAYGVIPWIVLVWCLLPVISTRH